MVTFLAWPQPGFITTDLAVPHLHKSIWRPGLQADPSCSYPAWLPVLWGAAGSHRLLTLTGEYILSPVAQRKARIIRKVELGCAGLVPFPHARMAVSLLFNITNQPQGLTPTVFKNEKFPRKTFSVVTHLTITDSQLRQSSRGDPASPSRDLFS